MKILLSLVSLLLFSNMSFANTRLPTDIVDTAIADGNFKTLVAAVSAAGLVDTLKGDGPFTVFAPTDSAFAKLPAGTIEVLLGNIPLLTKILTYHVVSGELSEEELLNTRWVQTVQGQKVKVTEKFSGKMSHLYINNSKVLGKVLVKNGVIYVLDTVLMPK